MLYASHNDDFTPTAIVEGVSTRKDLVKCRCSYISAVLCRNQPEISDQETSNSVENTNYSDGARRGPLHNERRRRAVYIIDAVTVADNTGAKSRKQEKEGGDKWRSYLPYQMASAVQQWNASPLSSSPSLS
ncbi:hypothetical protein ACFX1Z_018321 [Malus domestica]